MQVTTENKSEKQLNAEADSGWMADVLQSPLVWGGLLTVGFYQLIPFLPAQRELAERYFCSHPLEYATTALFFVGIAVLALKGLRISTEKATLEAGLFDLAELTDIDDPQERIARIEKSLAPLPMRVKRTHLFGRIRDVCGYLRRRKGSEGLEEHLRYLAELTGERMRDSYALVRTISWAVPILGFLGTVIGITIAVANVTPEQLETSLTEVTGGLAVAFDTTALALTLSMVLVFGVFMIERAEQQILARVEDFGTEQLVELLPVAPTAPIAKGSFAEAEAEAARQLIDRTQTLIDWQTGLWQSALESARERWTESLQNQQDEFSKLLTEGVQSTFNDHSEQLAEIRAEFIQAFQNVSKELNATWGEARFQQQSMHESFRGQMGELWKQIEVGLNGLREDEKLRIDALVEAVSDKNTEWQVQLKESNDLTAHQIEELRLQREVLIQVVQDEQQLTRLQARLVDNLNAVRTAETFEETLHSLSAAVHLLTTRVKPRAA